MAPDPQSDDELVDVEEDTASYTAALDTPRLSAAVQQILAYKRQEESTEVGTEAGALAALGADVRPSCEEWTSRLREFSEAVTRLRSEQDPRGEQQPKGGLEVRTYLDLQGYNLEAVADKRRKAPHHTVDVHVLLSHL